MEWQLQIMMKNHSVSAYEGRIDKERPKSEKVAREKNEMVVHKELIVEYMCNVSYLLLIHSRVPTKSNQRAPARLISGKRDLHYNLHYS